jgi:hypothetical protein
LLPATVRGKLVAVSRFRASTASDSDKKIWVERPAGARSIPGQYPPGTMIRFSSPS